MGVFTRAFDSIRQMWGRLTPPRRTVVAALVVAVVIGLFWGSLATTSDGMVRVVGSDVDDVTREEIVRKLQEKSEKYEVRGRELYLPRESADRVVGELAGDGVVSDRVVWQYLDSPDMLVSQWQREKRFQVALQTKLEMMIRKINGVRAATVLLSPASQDLGFRDSVKASASVQVELRPPANFGNKQAHAVAGLVALAVPGLDIDRVQITDNLGRSYRAPHENGNLAASGDIRDLETRLEEDIKAKIMDLFRNASVAVRVVAKTQDVHTIEKKFGKRTPKVEEERQRVVKTDSAGGTSGIKGGTELAPEKTQTPAPVSEKDTTTRTENLVDEVIKDMKDPAGAIEKITIAVLIPQEAGMTLEVAKSLISKAAAIPLDDNLLAVHFTAPVRHEAVVPVLVPSWTGWLFSNWSTVGLILLGLAGILALVWIVRRAMPSGTVEEIQALTAQLAPGPELAGSQAVLAEADSVLQVKQGIQEMIGRNPSGAAAGIKQWMSESR